MKGPLVYKVGGPALEDPSLVGPLAAEVIRAGRPVALVHGGGRQVNRLLEALAIESQFIDGRRVTSPEAMDVVEMALSGLANKALAAGLTKAGVLAAGISCRDAGLVVAKLEPGLGRVGIPHTVRPAIIEALWAAGIVPVVSPVASTEDGASVNVNADEAALGLARSLGASSLVYLSDVDGVRIEEKAVASLSATEAEARIADGTIGLGMVLKVRVALEASRSIPEVVIAGRARLEGGFAGTTITVEEVQS